MANPNDLPITGSDTGQSINQAQGNPVGTTGINSVNATPNPITPESLTPKTPVNIPPATPPNNSGADGLVAGAGQTSKGVDQYIKDLTPAPTAAETQQQDILNSETDLTKQLGQKGADQLAAENAAGINQKQQDLQNLNNELVTKTADYNKQFTQLGGNGAVETSAVYNAQTAGLRMAQAADIGLTTAKISAAQGNLTLAQNQVNRAIDLKYSTIQAQLDTKQAQLNALLPTLNKEEKIAALAQQQKLTDQANALADKKAEEKTNLSTALTAGVKTSFVNENGKFFDARTGQTFPDMASFFKAAGVSSFAEAYQKGLVTDVNPATMADQNLVAQAAAKYPDAGIKLTDTPAQMTAKLKNSAIYRKETYIAPVAGSGGSGGNGYVPGTNPVIDSWVQNINSGKAKLSDVPNNLLNAVAQGMAATGGTTAASDLLGITAQSLKDLNDAVNKTGFSGAVGAKGPSSLFGLLKAPLPGTAAANFDAKLKQTVNDVVLPNLTILHGLGRVTDREFQALSSSITSLSTNLSETEFKSELQKVTDRVTQKINDLKTSNTPPTGQVLVKDKNGVSGYIPANQLQDALKQGYTQ